MGDIGAGCRPGAGSGAAGDHEVRVDTGFLAGNTPADRLRPEPADRGVIPGIHRNLNKPQRHAADPRLSWLNSMNRPEGPYTTPVDSNRIQRFGYPAPLTLKAEGW